LWPSDKILARAAGESSSILSGNMIFFFVFFNLTTSMRVFSQLISTSKKMCSAFRFGLIYTLVFFVFFFSCKLCTLSSVAELSRRLIRLISERERRTCRRVFTFSILLVISRCYFTTAKKCTKMYNVRVQSGVLDAVAVLVL